MSSAAAASPAPGYLRAADDLRENPGQWQAYESKRHCVVLAGPGSGKTKTLAIKMARMAQEDVRSPRGIACITYNNECARELTRRLDELGVRSARDLFIGTVHSFCLKNVVLPYASLAELGIPHDPVVASPDTQARLFERALAREIGVDERPGRWRTRFDAYRRTHLDREAESWREEPELSALIERYEHLLREDGLIDFEGIVLAGLQIITTQAWARRALYARFPILVVDEYQDLGLPLHRIVVSLCMEAGVRLFAVGDPDQSIYGFTGAKPELLRELSEMEGVERVALPFNYRSGSRIVTASEVALGEARGYKSKATEPGTIFFHEVPEGLEEQAARISTEIIPGALERRGGRSLGQIAVLYLDKNDGDVIARQAAANDFKCIRIDRGAPYPKTRLTRWLEDCAAWCSGGWKRGAPRLAGLIEVWLGLNLSIKGAPELRELSRRLVHFLATHRSPDMGLSHWLTECAAELLDPTLAREPTLGDEVEALQRLRDSSAPDGDLGSVTVREFSGQTGAPDHLNLITLHSAKGLEFDVVVMMGMEQGRIPSWAATTSEARREPRRLFYVGLTRARHEVHMTYSGWTQNQYGRRFNNGPSEFLLEVQARLSALDEEASHGAE